jgi:hypothetical protein
MEGKWLLGYKFIVHKTWRPMGQGNETKWKFDLES